MEDDKLVIDDINELKITKIKPWAINFKYKREHYVIHGESETGEGSWQVLYHKIMHGDKKIAMKQIGYSVYASEFVANDYFPYRSIETYSSLDKEDFVYKMTARGLISSKYNDEVDVLKKEIDELQKQERSLCKELSIVKIKIRNLQNQLRQGKIKLEDLK